MPISPRKPPKTPPTIGTTLVVKVSLSLCCTVEFMLEVGVGTTELGGVDVMNCVTIMEVFCAIVDRTTGTTGSAEDVEGAGVVGSEELVVLSELLQDAKRVTVGRV